MNIPPMGLTAGLMLALAALPLAAVGKAFRFGTLDLALRYRAEWVDDQIHRNALASTLRTTLAYGTPGWHGLGAHLELENVSVIGNEDLYDDGGSNGVSDRAAVVDPQGTELNQGYAEWRGGGWTLRAGRQVLTHRSAPLHRFIGNVGWRQNWQTMDGLRGRYRNERTSVEFDYVFNVNRIFGESNRLPNRADFDVDALMLRSTHRLSAAIDLEGYAYWLRFDDAASLSTMTLGARASGTWARDQAFDIVYALEAAYQGDAANNPDAHQVGYLQAEAGLGRGGWRYMAGLELLTGDGRSSFQTPLATLHAFQGWADRFLSTPADGVRDVYVRLAGKLSKLSAQLVVHRFDAHHGGFSYGREIDLMLTRQVGERLTLGLKGAAYAGDANRRNLLRGNDTRKVWLWLAWKTR